MSTINIKRLLSGNHLFVIFVRDSTVVCFLRVEPSESIRQLSVFKLKKSILIADHLLRKACYRWLQFVPCNATHCHIRPSWWYGMTTERSQWKTACQKGIICKLRVNVEKRINVRILLLLLILCTDWKHVDCRWRGLGTKLAWNNNLHKATTGVLKSSKFFYVQGFCPLCKRFITSIDLNGNHGFP